MTRFVRVAASLTAHAQARHDIFVSDHPDLSLRGGRRRPLSRLLKTRLLTTDEFWSSLTRSKDGGKNHGNAD